MEAIEATASLTANPTRYVRYHTDAEYAQAIGKASWQCKKAALATSEELRDNLQYNIRINTERRIRMFASLEVTSRWLVQFAHSCGGCNTCEGDVICEIRRYPTEMQPFMIAEWEDHKKDPMFIALRESKPTVLYIRAINKIRTHYPDRFGMGAWIRIQKKKMTENLRGGT